MNSHLESQIIEVEEQLRQAMLASDVSALDALLSSDLVFTNHLGQRVPKAADLAAHRSGELTIKRLTPSAQRIQPVTDAVAVVSVCMLIDGTYAGQSAGGQFMFTRVWGLTGAGRWQVVAAHAGLVV
ncbi:MAG: nuclear transport factor 2 family protein [Burkholderiaceae bacterium]